MEQFSFVLFSECNELRPILCASAFLFPFVCTNFILQGKMSIFNSHLYI